MKAVKFVLNGEEVSAGEGVTILQAAEERGVEIPTLCHSPDLTPAGVCRVCIVEVEGSRALVGSCHTPVTEGMVVHTHSSAVLAARRAIVELLLAGHTGSCVSDSNARNCGLHRLASDLQVGPPRFAMRKPRYFPAEDANPYVCRDLSKCILCHKCTRACDEIAGKNVLAIAYRGFRSKISVGFDEPLVEETCRDCGVCVDYCPTGALSRPLGERGEGAA
jgi:NADH dehydrogenase/NADH:ubiquinone oxidoreductase subunit G